tara:strand:+ start:341 stop:1264 length:924 start_codon:yes stop_codon:yes gene_type:complete
MRCLICNNKTVFLDKYKFNVKSDVEYLGDNDIYQCKDCNFSFCHPMPKKINLDKFYQKIYRSYGRPHEYDLVDIRKNYNSFKNLDYLNYLEKFINLNEISKLFDFGSGTGCLGYLIKTNYEKILINSAESDNNCKKILQERNYKNYENIDEINEKFDLIISLHSLEHLTDLNIINNFKNLAEKNSYIFLEVPNCEFNLSFKSRPYDSPHLMFFTKESLQKIAKKYSLEIINLSYCSIPLEENFENMSNAKKKYENWKKGKFKDFLKSLIRKMLKKIRIFKTHENSQKKIYQENDKNLSNLRVLFKVK